jgi:predicted nucleic acid-binding protein
LIVVLDTSAAIASMTSGPNILDEADAVYVPDLYIAEATNVVWKQHHFTQISLSTCEAALDRLLRLPDVVVPSAMLSRAAFHLARNSAHSVYDMFYVALAQREAATLYTKDKALRKLAQHYKIEVA